MDVNEKRAKFIKKVPKTRADAPKRACAEPGVKKRDIKILCYWCQEKYWNKTPHTVLQDDEALFLREMTGFEAALRPYLMNGYEIKQVCHNRHVDYFVIFLEKELG